MPGVLWLVLLLTLGVLTVAGVAEVPSHQRPVIRRGSDGRYWVRWRGHTYGPHMSWDRANGTAVQLLAREARR